MNGPEHVRRAEQLEQLAVRQYEGSDVTEPNPLWQLTIQQARLHATLALFDRLQEIGDQLDTLPRKSGILTDDDILRCPHGYAVCGLCGYGVPAGDGGRS